MSVLVALLAARINRLAVTDERQLEDRQFNR